jgi:hypothetical protein
VKLNFPRAVIVLCSLGSLALGWFVYERSERLAQVESDLARVEGVVRSISEHAYRVNDLMRISSDEKFKAQGDIESYIRRVAADGKINMGQVDVNRRTDNPSKEIEDVVCTIKPMAKTQRYTRGQVGNFLFKLESDSRRVKVTRVKLTPYERLSPGEIGDDYWVFEAELTSRVNLGGAN